MANDPNLNPGGKAQIDFVLNDTGVGPELQQINRVLQTLGATSSDVGGRFANMLAQIKLVTAQLSAASAVAKTSAYGLAGLENKLMTQRQRDQQILFSNHIADNELRNQKKVAAAREAYVAEVIARDRSLAIHYGKNAVEEQRTKKAARQLEAAKAAATAEFDLMVSSRKASLAEELRLQKLAADAKERAAFQQLSSFEQKLYTRTQRKHKEELLAISDVEKRRVAIIAAAQREIDLIRAGGGATTIPANFVLGSSTSSAFQEAQLNLSRQYAAKESQVKVDAAAKDAERQRKADAAELAAEQRQTQRLYNNLVERMAKQEAKTNAHYTAEEARLAAHQRAMSAIAAKGINTSSIQSLSANPHLQTRIDANLPQPLNLKQPEPKLNPTAMGVARQESFGGLGTQQMRVNTLLGYAGAASVVGGLTMGITQIIQFEQALKNLQAISGTTNAEMVGLGRTLRNVAQDFSFTAVETAQAATILAQAGYTGKQIEESLRGVLMLAQATGSQVEMSADIMSTVQSVFQRDASSSMEVANLLTSAVNRTKLGMQQIQLGLQYAGNSAADLKIPFVELVSVFGAATQAGIRSASTIGTGTRKLLEDLAEPNTKYLERLKARGIALEDVDVRTIGLTRTLENLKEAEFSAADAMYSFDVRGQNMYSAVTGQMDMFTRLPGEISNTTAALDAQRTQMEGLSAASGQLGTNLTILFERMAAPTIGVLVQATHGLTSFIQVLSNNSEWLTTSFSVLAVILVSRIPLAVAALTRNFFAWTGALSAARAAVAGTTTATAVQTTSFVALVRAQVAATLATNGFTASQTLASRAVLAGTTALVAARGVLAGFVGLLGGPFGVAIAAAVGAMYLLNQEYASAEKAAADAAETASQSTNEYEKQTAAVISLGKDTDAYQKKLKSLGAEATLTSSEFEDLTARHKDLIAEGITADSTMRQVVDALAKLKASSYDAGAAFVQQQKDMANAAQAAYVLSNQLKGVELIQARLARHRTGSISDPMVDGGVGLGELTPIGVPYRLANGTYAKGVIGPNGKRTEIRATAPGAPLSREGETAARAQRQAAEAARANAKIVNDPRVIEASSRYTQASSAEERNRYAKEVRTAVRAAAPAEAFRPNTPSRTGVLLAQDAYLARYRSYDNDRLPESAPAPAGGGARGASANAALARQRFAQATAGRGVTGAREYNPQRTEANIRSTGEALKAAIVAQERARPGGTEASAAALAAGVDVQINNSVARQAEARARIDATRKAGQTAEANRLANIQRGDVTAAIGAERGANQARRAEITGSLDRSSTFAELDTARDQLMALLTEDTVLAAQEIRAQFERRHRGSISATDPELVTALDALAAQSTAERNKLLEDIAQRREIVQFNMDKLAAEAVLLSEKRKVDTLLYNGSTDLYDLMSAVEDSVAAQMEATEKAFRAEQRIAAAAELTPEQRAALNEMQKALRVTITTMAQAQIDAVTRQLEQSPVGQELARRGASQSGQGANRTNSIDRGFYERAQRALDLQKINAEVQARSDAIARLNTRLGLNKTPMVSTDGRPFERSNVPELTEAERAEAIKELADAHVQLNAALVARVAITGELTDEQVRLAESYRLQIGGALSQVLEQSTVFYTAAQTVGEGTKTMFNSLLDGIRTVYSDILTNNKEGINSFEDFKRAVSDFSQSLSQTFARMAADVVANYTILKLIGWVFPENATGVRGEIGAAIRATPGFPQKTQRAPAPTPSGVAGIVEGDNTVLKNPERLVTDWVSNLFNNVFDKSKKGGGLLNSITSLVGGFFSKIFRGLDGGGGGEGGGWLSTVFQFASSMFSRAEGGYIPGQKNNLDRVRVRASGGEYMLRSSAVDSLGVDTLNRMNQLGAAGLPRIPVAVSVPTGVSAASQKAMTQLQNAPREAPTNLEQKIYMVDERSQIPSLGPNDVVSIIMENARSRGPVLQMIKAVAKGGMG